MPAIMVRFVLATAFSLWVASTAVVAAVQAADTSKPNERKKSSSSSFLKSKSASAGQQQQGTRATAGENKWVTLLQKKNQQRKTWANAPTGAVATEKNKSNQGSSRLLVKQNQQQGQRKTRANGGGGCPVRRQLQIIHSSDNESSFIDPNTLEEKINNYATVVNGLTAVADAASIPSIHVTAGDLTLPGPFYEAATEAVEFGHPGLADIAMFNAMGLDGNGLGNHEFDGGSSEFAYMLFAAGFPFISVNLDFSNSTLTDNCAPAIRIGPDANECAAVAGHVVKSCYIPTSIGRIGLIGRSPADFFNVVLDPATTLPGIDFVGGRDPNTNQPLLSALPMVAKQVSLLEDMGVNIIVLLDHAQDFTSDPLSTSLLSGIDVIVSAGSTGFFGQSSAFGPYNTLRPGDEPTTSYPVVQTDKNGDKVLIVNSDQQYLYVGNLLVEFDTDGKLLTWDGRSGPVAATEEAIALFSPVPEPNCDVEGILDVLKATKSIKDAFTVVGETVYPLNGVRGDVRTKETNLARLVADSTLWGGNSYAECNGLPSVDIAFKNGGGIRDSITGPNIIRLTIQAALAFDNKLRLVSLNGEQLLAAMENAVSRVPAADGRYPQTAGLYMEYDITKPGVQAAAALSKPSRVKTLKVDDVVLIEKFVPVGDLLCFNFTVATNSFLTTGGDGYNSFANGTILGETDMGEQQILEEYIATELAGMVNITEPPTKPRVVRVASSNTTESPK